MKSKEKRNILEDIYRSNLIDEKDYTFFIIKILKKALNEIIKKQEKQLRIEKQSAKKLLQSPNIKLKLY